MRLSTDEDRSEAAAMETIAAACEAGITVFDTARAYGLGADDLGHNERLVARALRACGADGRARIVTKGGMTRPGGRWVTDGRAKAIRADCEASLAALDGIAIDCYLLHAPDPRTPWRTSLRALARLADEGVVRRVGVANVNRDQLDEALELAPIAVVSVGLSPLDDRALRAGVVERCADAGIAVIAHAPLGGPRRAASLARRSELAEVAAARGLTAAEVALAWLLDLSPVVVPIPGARRPETARSAARAASVVLAEDERARLARAFGAIRREPRRQVVGDGEAVIVMGIPGAGKSRLARDYADRGYERLNRDERGGSLRRLAAALDERLGAGARRVVLDNTYLTRAARSHVVDAAARHGLPVRCVWLRTPLAQAQVNMVERLLERFGGLPTSDELREAARREPWLLTATAQMRTVRELEPPALDEGFAALEEVDFERAPSGVRAGGVLVAAASIGRPGWREALASADPAAPHLVFDWSPGGGSAAAAAAAQLRVVVSGPVEHAACPHPGGPPPCWCRPPLPGLPLAFCRTHRLEPARSTVIGTAPVHRTLAAALGARHVET
jgi:aryl-alcohol dehydrogenase-like predicted oxidoreductase/adenylate kinase family enzyme